MEEPKEKPIPGTATTYAEQGEKGFSKIKMLLESTGGLSLSQVCTVTGLESSTIQNWVKRGWVAHPKGKKYKEVHIARILIINALKDCIKLEHISLLMTYVSQSAEGKKEGIISESELYNYLCSALQLLGKADDQSRGGVEAVVEIVIKDYVGPKPDSRIRIRKTLTIMIFACVCTDVKRRTETMMTQVLHELEHPEIIAAEAQIPQIPQPAAPAPTEAIISEETRKTVSQAIREWDLSRVEDVLKEDNGETAPSGNSLRPASPAGSGAQLDDSADNTQQKPYYFRKN